MFTYFFVVIYIFCLEVKEIWELYKQPPDLLSLAETLGRVLLLI